MKKETIADQCRKSGISLSTYYSRKAKGWDNPFQPSTIKERYISKKTRDLLKRNGIHRATYFARLNLGWSEFEAANVAPRAEAYRVNGKTVHSQLNDYRYRTFLDLVTYDKLSIEDAFYAATRSCKK